MEFRRLRADEIDVRVGNMKKDGSGFSLLLYKDARCDMNILEHWRNRQMEFRRLRADEIDVRVGNMKKDGSGFSLLLYKDARCDMNILDETVGALNWQRSHQTINGCLYCTVSLYNEGTGQWISKSDVGTKSRAEPEKGEASDSFKRACTNWGIGRELYTAPFICVPISIASKEDKFKVKKIEYDETGNIKELIIINKQNNMTIYPLPKQATQVTNHTVSSPNNKVNQSPVQGSGAQCMGCGKNKQNNMTIYPLPKQATQVTNHTVSSPNNKVNQSPVQGSGAQCMGCGKTITPAEVNYSNNKFGKSLCRVCQAKQ